MNKRIVIPRRTVLRGLLGSVAVAMALPPLEAMFDESGTALADGNPIPKRFGFFWWGSGVRLDRWIPKVQGPGWSGAGNAIPEELQPFTKRGLGDKINIVSGLDLKIQGTGHWIGKVGMRAGGADDLVNKMYYGYGGPRIEEIVASNWKGKAAIQDLVQVSVSKHNFENLPPNPEGETSPQKLWDLLFQKSTTVTPDPIATKRTEMRLSVLDAVSAEAKALRPRLGMADRARLDKHLENIASIEKAVQAAPNTCKPPMRPGDDFPYDANHEELESISDTMSDILAVAFACDLTRVFSFVLSGMQCDTVFWQVGASNGQHFCTHDAALQEHVHNGVVFTMERFAYLLDKIDSYQEGAGTVLDNSLIMGTTEVAEGESHSTFDIPVLLAGKAGGAMKSGLHYRSPNKENTSKVHLTCLKALGLPVTEFGKDGAYTTDILPALLT